MKKINFLILGLLLTFIVNGQDKKLSIGIVGSPDFYNYDFNSTPTFNHKYKSKINYSAGLRLQYSFTEKFGITTGLQYSTKGYILDYNWIVSDANDPLIPEESNLEVNYLDIPLTITYNFIIRDKLSLFTSTGVVMGFLMNNKETSTMADGSKKENEFLNVLYQQKLNSTLLALELGLGLKYNLNEKLFLTLVPHFRYGFNKIDDDILKSVPTSYGVLLGFHYNLK
jgi:hypothetical protein